MNPYAVTGFDLTKRIRETRQRLNPPPITTTLSEPPRRVTAATWERQPRLCDVCGNPMTKETFSEHYFCLSCSQAIAEEAKQRVVTGRLKALFPRRGDLFRHVARAGIFMRDMRRSMQDSVVAGLLPPPAQRPSTRPLPARDITYAPTPIPQPITPRPPTRADLFSDVPEQAEIDEDERDEDVTEKRRIIIRTDHLEARATRQMRVEALLEALMASPVYGQTTGENERVDADAWLR